MAWDATVGDTLSPSALRSQGMQRRRPRSGKFRSMPVCRHLIYLFQQLSRLSALSMKLDTLYGLKLAGVFQDSLTILRSRSYSSNISQFLCRGLTRSPLKSLLTKRQVTMSSRFFLPVFNLIFLTLGIINTECTLNNINNTKAKKNGYV